jgi:hypothetical protein
MPRRNAVKPNSKKRKKCVRVEWDLNYSGGNYSDVGNFVYIPLDMIDRQKGRSEQSKLEKAFRQMTGQDPVHIVHWSPDEVFDQDGNDWSDD